MNIFDTVNTEVNTMLNNIYHITSVVRQHVVDLTSSLQNAQTTMAERAWAIAKMVLLFFLDAFLIWTNPGCFLFGTLAGIAFHNQVEEVFEGIDFFIRRQPLTVLIGAGLYLTLALPFTVLVIAVLAGAYFGSQIIKSMIRGADDPNDIPVIFRRPAAANA